MYFPPKELKTHNLLGHEDTFEVLMKITIFMVYKLSPILGIYTPQLLILIPRQHGHFVFRTPCFVAVLQRNVHNILFIYLSNL